MPDTSPTIPADEHLEQLQDDAAAAEQKAQHATTAAATAANALAAASSQLVTPFAAYQPYLVHGLVGNMQQAVEVMDAGLAVRAVMWVHPQEPTGRHSGPVS